MTIGVGDDVEGLDGLDDLDHRETGLAEFAALSLFVVETFVILGFVAAAIANQVQYGTQDLGGEGAHTWGYTLTLATEWSSPPAVVAFLLGPLALVAWIRTREGDELTVGRTMLVLRLALVLAALTALGGILSIVGHVMEVSPSENWSVFLVALGTGLGTICLAIVGIVVVTKLGVFVPRDEDR